MVWEFFSFLVYTPLYNTLVFLIDTVPSGNVGVAIVLLTVLVKTLLFPLAKKAIHTQVAMKKVAPEVERIKKEFKDDQQKQVQNMMDVYKKYNVNPLAGFATILVQIPVVIGLYLIFFKGGLPSIDTTLLYTFISSPTQVSMSFFGIDLSGKSILLALCAGFMQYLIGRFSFEAPELKTQPGESLKDDVMRTLHLQTKYMLPVLITVFAYTLSAAIALHWTVGNIFTVIQDYFVKKRLYAKDSRYGTGDKR
ncbi:MAG: YidC/Oxa1 family membrane protein insertase [Patescibacteria group bacterium]